MTTLRFTLAENSPKAEFQLLKEMYDSYVKDAWSFTELEVVTPTGTFTNIGGFNGNPSDLWLIKKGTLGKTSKTFWRTSFGSKKSGFKVFVYDLKSIKVTKDNINEVAELIGAKIIGDSLQYFTI